MSKKLEEGASLLALCAAEPETDIGNGRRFIHRYGGDVFHMDKIGWHVWDGLRWREDDDKSAVRKLVQKTAEAIRFECEEIGPDEGEAILIEDGQQAMIDLPAARKAKDEDRIARIRQAIEIAKEIEDAVEARVKRRATHCRSTCSTNKMDHMLNEAAPHRKRRMEDLNADPLAINCRNGTLRFVKVEDEESDPAEPRFRWFARLDAHEREDWITKLCEASVCGRDGKPLEPGETLYTQDDFSIAAPKLAPTFFPFIQRVQPDLARRQYLQRHAGYMLTGLTSEQMVLFFHGIGANGKSTYADVIGQIMNDYSVTLSIDSFTGDSKRDGAAATPDLVRLNGANGCFANEGEEGSKIKEGLIKSLTGGDKLPVRKMREEFIEIVVKAKFVIIGNHKPMIRGDDDGIWRRVHLLEWPVQIPANERDKQLVAKLLRERDGILAWMIAGTLEFLTLGALQPPDSVLAAVQDHREESDSLGAFVRGACVVTGDNKDQESSGELYPAYCAYCRQEGIYALHQATFNRRFPELTRRTWKAPDGTMTQFAKSKSNGTSVYRGIKIKDQFRGGAAPVGEPDGRPFSPRG